MICLILAAGYATRLYPLTENFPKPLLKVGSKTIMDHLTDDIHSSGEVTEYVVISNHKYAHFFEEWANTKDMKITVLDDMTESNETRLGAVRDIQFAIDTLKPDDDMLVIAGDNVLDFSLTSFINYAKSKNTSCVMRYYEPETKKLCRSAALEIDGNDLVLNMEEKPSEPKSNWCCPPFYYYSREDAKRVAVALKDGAGADAPGSFIAWLCHHSPVHAMEMPGKRYDIGTLESYEAVQKEFEAK